MSTYNNFEYLLFVASEECSRKQAEEFLQVNDEGFEITDKQRKRMKQLIRKHSKKEKAKASALKWKWIAVACLLTLSIGLTACVSITELREAIKKFFLDWKEDFVAVGFGNEKPDTSRFEKIDVGDAADVNSDSSTQPSDNTTNEELPPPTEIIKKAYATYLPGSYTTVVDIDSGFYYSISYYNNSNYVFSLMQNVITEELHWTNSASHKVYATTINGFNAIIIENTSVNGEYIAMWQDNEYEYNIEGTFASMDEIIKVAEGIKLK
ncbi:MAG: DUF4367 domain-containing protein [Ruminococcaceae bacterium]|nr:DUF4367 domain-containing protein [Oscillospiraceae bacterium]